MLYKCALNKEDQLNNENIEKRIFLNYIFHEIKTKYTKTHLQKLKDSLEKMDKYMECYRHYIHH